MSKERGIDKLKLLLQAIGPKSEVFFQRVEALKAKLSKTRKKGKDTNYELLFRKIAERGYVTAEEFNDLFPKSKYAPDLVSTCLREMEPYLTQNGLEILYISTYVLVLAEESDDGEDA